MIMIGRAINGISINGLEFVLDSIVGDVMLFESEEKAKDFLRDNGADPEDEGFHLVEEDGL